MKYLVLVVISLVSVFAINGADDILHLPESDGLPSRMVGMYLLLADDTIANYTSNDNWTPAIPDYLQKGSNVVFFTFINPESMKVPPAYANLAKTRGKGTPGSIPSGTKIIFSVGGYSYSIKPNPWPFLASASAAATMAREVATWPSKYGCDGIDLDIETGAGDASGAGPNLVTFVQTLKQQNPSMIVTQPVYGYPQVAAETYIVNHSWNKNGTSQGLADAVGIMVYQGQGSLQYVKNYAQGSHQWDGFPITVDVTPGAILCGMGGQDSSGDIQAVASAVKQQGLGGIMVWFASILDTKTGKTAFQYAGGTGDASVQGSAEWAHALSIMQ